MEIIGWIILGALAGWIASMIMKTNAEQGAIGNIVVGIIGAIIGGFLYENVLGANRDSLLESLLVAVGGSVILLAILRAFGRGHPREA